MCRIRHRLSLRHHVCCPALGRQYGDFSCCAMRILPPQPPTSTIACTGAKPVLSRTYTGQAQGATWWHKMLPLSRYGFGTPVLDAEGVWARAEDHSTVSGGIGSLASGKEQRLRLQAKYTRRRRATSSARRLQHCIRGGRTTAWHARRPPQYKRRREKPRKNVVYDVLVRACTIYDEALLLRSLDLDAACLHGQRTVLLALFARVRLT